ncbi:MAG: hypothetical protein HGA35_06380, partial [Erysipelotrichaceae bacterium]|nr:hypothetical protein [Erysipelotrichaceae bacterium]
AMNSEYGPYGFWEGTEEAFEEHVKTQLEKIRNAPVVAFPTLEIGKSQFPRCAPETRHRLEILVSIFTDQDEIPFSVLNHVNIMGTPFFQNCKLANSTRPGNYNGLVLAPFFQPQGTGEAVEKTESHNPFFRVDLLTGCNNLVSFSDALSNNFKNIKN